MIVFVDLQHASGHEGESTERLMASRTWITYRLEDLSGLPCMLVRYDRLTEELLDHLDARALFLSGNSTDPDLYSPADLEPFFTILRAATRPIFGFCGGMQFIARALGVDVVELDAPEGAELREIYEYGYFPITTTAPHDLLAGLGPTPVVRHAHRLHVPEPPVGFRAVAETDRTPVQMMVDEERTIVGTQFHPEYYTDEHPAGRVMIENFLDWAEIRQPPRVTPR